MSTLLAACANFVPLTINGPNAPTAHLVVPLLRLRGGLQLQPPAPRLARPAWQRAPRHTLLHAVATASQQPSDTPKSSTRALLATAFIFVLSISITSLAPAPFMVQALGEVPAMKLLMAVATSSAIVEIGLSPLVGGLADSVGRKAVLMCTVGCQLISSLLVAVWPTVPLVALSKFISSAVVGLFFLAGGAITADSYRTDPKRLAAVSGVLFALVSLALGVGVSISGAPFMPTSLQGKYVASVAMGVLALIAAAFGVRESLPVASRVPFKAKSFNPFSFVRLLKASARMRNLVVLATLATAPIFMGDVMQLFAIRQWGLSAADTSKMFGGLAISGVLANVLSGSLIARLGIQGFTVLATASTLLLWAGFASASLKATIVCAIVGVVGPARVLGATTMITTEGARLGMPQGQLSGDRSNLNAWLKVLGPVVYGTLYTRGVAAGVPTAPFYLNVLLAAIALLMSPMAIGSEEDDDPMGTKRP